MGTLLDLITSLGPAPDASAIAAPSCTKASTPSANDHQQRAGEPSPIPIQAPEATSEPRRTAWRITRAGRPAGYMVGQLMTYSEALTSALIRWPDAEILETK